LGWVGVTHTNTNSTDDSHDEVTLLYHFEPFVEDIVKIMETFFLFFANLNTNEIYLNMPDVVVSSFDKTALKSPCFEHLFKRNVICVGRLRKKPPPPYCHLLNYLS